MKKSALVNMNFSCNVYCLFIIFFIFFCSDPCFLEVRRGEQVKWTFTLHGPAQSRMSVCLHSEPRLHEDGPRHKVLSVATGIV